VAYTQSLCPIKKTDVMKYSQSEIEKIIQTGETESVEFKIQHKNSPPHQPQNNFKIILYIYKIIY
jgi:hypothetical protein